MKLLSLSAALLLAACGTVQAQGAIGTMLYPGRPAASSEPEAVPPALPPAPQAALEAPARPVSDERPSRARPLFAPSRRPPAVPVAVAPPPPEPEPPPPPPPPKPVPDLRLIGVIEGTETPLALVRPRSGDKTLTVRVGDRIEEWEVGAIEPHRVVLRDGAREQAYAVFVRPPANPEGGPAARSVPPGLESYLR